MAATDWRQPLSADDGYELGPGAAAGEIAGAEAALKAVFPAELRQLYLLSDGVLDRAGQWFVIWPLAEVITRNRQAWVQDGSPSRRELVGFGDDGTGAPFCVPRDGSSGVSAGRRSAVRRPRWRAQCPAFGMDGSLAHPRRISQPRSPASSGQT